MYNIIGSLHLLGVYIEYSVHYVQRLVGYPYNAIILRNTYIKQSLSALTLPGFHTDRGDLHMWRSLPGWVCVNFRVSVAPPSPSPVFIGHMSFLHSACGDALHIVNLLCVCILCGHVYVCFIIRVYMGTYCMSIHVFLVCYDLCLVLCRLLILLKLLRKRLPRKTCRQEGWTNIYYRFLTFVGDYMKTSSLWRGLVPFSFFNIITFCRWCVMYLLMILYNFCNKHNDFTLYLV